MMVATATKHVGEISLRILLKPYY